MIIWVIAGLLGLATGLRIGWALVNKQSLVSTAMILALGSLGLVAALNWQPLTLLIDTVLHWPNISMGLSQVALIACAAGSCVMITTVSSERTPATSSQNRYRAVRRCRGYRGREFGDLLRRGPATGDGARGIPQAQPRLQRRKSSPWLLPLLYVLLALTLVSWAGMRHSNRSRRGRALFVFTLGIVLIVLASAFFLHAGGGHHRSSSASGRRPPCWAAPCWSSPQGRCCPASKTGSALATSCARSSPCSRSSVGAILMSASAYVPAVRWCSGSPSECR